MKWRPCTAGHYAVPLSRNMKILSDIIARPLPINLNIRSIDLKDNGKWASVLHSKFSHFSPSTLLKLIKSADWRDNTCHFKEILKVTNDCEIFKELLCSRQTFANENVLANVFKRSCCCFFVGVLYISSTLLLASPSKHH